MCDVTPSCGLAGPGVSQGRVGSPCETSSHAGRRTARVASAVGVSVGAAGPAPRLCLSPAFSANGKDVIVDFPQQSHWTGLLSEMELVPSVHPGVT